MVAAETKIAKGMNRAKGGYKPHVPHRAHAGSKRQTLTQVIS